MTQIAVVEDDPSVAELLQSYIHQYKKKQQALDGYSVDAIGFILKPFDYCDFSQCLTRAINRVSKEMFIGNKNWRS